ncbi:protein cycle isoform X3 [Galleria mellonella]|uniref:Protein cycle isoform X3 n=1 Tax=Galleria mellonella TaxID=7137 RepID=A0ABM3MN11_GALME|nr:protein cycle isoform X3 [Galleria mellonella]
MARDYSRVQEYYFQLHELQPPPQHYHHHPYEIPQTNSSATQGYELTVGAGAGGVGAAVQGGVGGACAVAAGALVASHPPLPALVQPSHSHHDPRKRKNFSSEEYEMSGCESALSAPASATRKRKASSYSTSNAYDDDAGDDARSTRTLPDKKQNHSEIEKRRRDKMNTYITELSSMVPMCGAMARKLDKLTVLRMAVRHLRSVRGALSACPLTARSRPSFLSERELNTLILHLAHDCFLLVVGCDRGRLLYVSASVSNMLHYEQSELLGQSLFDILHPKDVAKVKEQLSSSDLSPRERLIDAKTMLPVKTDMVAGASRLCPGARRSFFCRIKCRLPMDAAVSSPTPVKEESEPSTKVRKKHHDKKYCVVQCTGYLKSWAPAETCEGGNGAEGGEEGDACNLSCLVAVGRALPDLMPAQVPRAPAPPEPPTRRLQYVSRHATDGKFLFVDQRVTLALGFLPQELLGTSLYEYVSGPELGAVARTHKTALLQRDAMHTPPYSFRRKDGTLARIQTHFKPFRNPWTKDVECLVANNTTLTEAHELLGQEEPQSSYDMFRHKNDLEMQRLIDSQMESHKIGSAIADEALRRSSSDFSPDLPADLLHDAVFNQQFVSGQGSLVDNIFGMDMASYSQVRNNVSLSSAGADNSPPPTTSEPMPMGTPPPASPPLPTLGIDGNGEAAMAVIMSLLEADAGLGGPINISGLPWPLP